MKRRFKTSSKPKVVSLPRYVFQVDRLSHEGRGVALYGTDPSHPVEKQGKKVFIFHALPGETVQAQLTQQSSKFEEAFNLELLSAPSPMRIDPVCPHFGQCGGCSMQHIHPDEQIRLKQEVLQSHLTHFAHLKVEQWLPALRATQTDYRHKARIGVRYLPQQNKLVMGFREAQSNKLTDIRSCKVMQQDLDGSLEDVYAMLSQLKGRADIGHIELTKGDPESALLVRHTANLASEDVERLRQFALDRSWQLYLQPAGNDSVHRVDQPNGPAELHYRFEQDNLNFSFHPTDFIQVNPSLNAKMVDLACQLLQLKAGESVLDLFCGLGNFSLALARRVGENGMVVAVEGSEMMVQRGTENAQKNRINNVTFYSQDLTKDFSQKTWANQGFDALLIDPPRAGAEQVMHYLPNFGAKKIVYVSCNPATLARDAGILAKYGYELKQAGVIDMFTHTGHVESIALFEKNQALND
ncbi:23S rRNA (uracil1939-C5)-methyltransferase [Acinetobacter calcoaceticus]|uniref:23S rRNA (uracil(1939)-C(5))-methyltransferase RlmD n=1 Tax=Acinetobacter calcoaceticus TaxID=471 RepID=A0A4V2R107_ACICA|nr:23S rRNA (uracil1939-C5)-methyltransferase [Acinetobacter calcoaceticus]